MPTRTNENSHSYLIHKCMEFTCVVVGFYPCYSYLPPLLQCLLHSFAITLHRTNVITLQNRLVSNTCSTSNLNNCLKIIHEDSNLLMLLLGLILALAVQVTVPGCTFAFLLRTVLSVAYNFVYLLILRHIFIWNVSTEIVESEQSKEKILCC